MSPRPYRRGSHHCAFNSIASRPKKETMGYRSMSEPNLEFHATHGQRSSIKCQGRGRGRQMLTKAHKVYVSASATATRRENHPAPETAPWVSIMLITTHLTMRPEPPKSNPKATANGSGNEGNKERASPPPNCHATSVPSFSVSNLFHTDHHQPSPSPTPPPILTFFDLSTTSQPSTPPPISLFAVDTMSTYRPSTRASSAAASITGGPRAAATPATPSASRGGRKKRGPSTIASELGPQVIATKESTSYGSSGAVVPMALNRVEEVDLRGALSGIVAPTTVGTPAGQRATTGSVPPTGASTSFGQESSLAGNGTFSGAPVGALGLAADLSAS
ncbi:hypothetical protein V492_05299, partial [Pseudogymnoascus sp. VKM F-4246]